MEGFCVERINIELGKYTASIDPDRIYQVFHEEMSGKKLAKQSFLHIVDWLDFKILKNEIETWGRVPIIFHVKVYRDLHTNQENSIYWGMPPDEQLMVFRREMLKWDVEEIRKRRMTKEIDLNDETIKKKRYRLLNKLVEKGYPREKASTAIKSLIEQHGTGVMGESSKDIMKMVDDLLIG